MLGKRTEEIWNITCTKKIIKKERIKEDVIDIFNKLNIKNLKKNQEKHVYSINGKCMCISILQDTPHEADHKRLQGSIIKQAQKYCLDVVGIYPVLNDNYTENSKYIFVVWEFNSFKDNNSFNPAVKVKLGKICKMCFGDNLGLKDKELSYKCTIYSSEDFIFSYLKMVNTLISNIKQNNKKDDSTIFTDVDAYKKVESIVRNSKLQSKFRDDLIKERNCKCQLCNINDRRLLVASHIESVSSIIYDDTIKDEEKCQKIVDTKNGLLLCVLHDALFDKYLITFEDDKKITLLSELKIISEELKINNQIIDFDETYMKKHRELFYKKHPEMKNK